MTDDNATSANINPIDADTSPAMATAPTATPPASLPWFWGFALAGCLLAGLFAPFLQADGEGVALSEGGGPILWIIGSAVAVALIGGFHSRAGFVEGLGLVAGVGISLVPIEGMLIRVLSALSDLSTAFGGSAVQPSVGMFAFGIGALIAVGVAFALPSLVRRVGARPAAPLSIPITVIGTVALTVGLIIPPIEGLSVADHVWTDDAWIGSMNVLFLTLLPISAMVLLRTRNRVAVAAVGGQMAWFLSSWYTAAAEFRSSGEQFVQFLNGHFALSTIGILATSSGVVIGLLAPTPSPGTDSAATPTATRSPAGLVFGLAAVAIIGLLGLSQHSSDSAFDNFVNDESGDSFDFDDGDFDSGLDDRSWIDGAEDLPFDPSLNDLAIACDDSDMGACDALYYAAPIGSDHEYFGRTCGARRNGTGGTCADEFSGD